MSTCPRLIKWSTRSIEHEQTMTELKQLHRSCPRLVDFVVTGMESFRAKDDFTWVKGTKQTHYPQKPPKRMTHNLCCANIDVTNMKNLTVRSSTQQVLDDLFESFPSPVPQLTHLELAWTSPSTINKYIIPLMLQTAATLEVLMIPNIQLKDATTTDTLHGDINNDTKSSSSLSMISEPMVSTITMPRLKQMYLASSYFPSLIAPLLETLTTTVPSSMLASLIIHNQSRLRRLSWDSPLSPLIPPVSSDPMRLSLNDIPLSTFKHLEYLRVTRTMIDFITILSRSTASSLLTSVAWTDPTRLERPQTTLPSIAAATSAAVSIATPPTTIPSSPSITSIPIISASTGNAITRQQLASLLSKFHLTCLYLTCDINWSDHNDDEEKKKEQPTYYSFDRVKHVTLDGNTLSSLLSIVRLPCVKHISISDESFTNSFVATAAAATATASSSPITPTIDAKEPPRALPLPPPPAILTDPLHFLCYTPHLEELKLSSRSAMIFSRQSASLAPRTIETIQLASSLLPSASSSSSSSTAIPTTDDGGAFPSPKSSSSTATPSSIWSFWTLTKVRRMIFDWNVHTDIILALLSNLRGATDDTTSSMSSITTTTATSSSHLTKAKCELIHFHYTPLEWRSNWDTYHSLQPQVNHWMHIIPVLPSSIELIGTLSTVEQVRSALHHLPHLHTIQILKSSRLDTIAMYNEVIAYCRQYRGYTGVAVDATLIPINQTNLRGRARESLSSDRHLRCIDSLSTLSPDGDNTENQDSSTRTSSSNNNGNRSVPSLITIEVARGNGRSFVEGQLVGDPSKWISLYFP
jgi:hypothetical protein